MNDLSASQLLAWSITKTKCRFVFRFVPLCVMVKPPPLVARQPLLQLLAACNTASTVADAAYNKQRVDDVSLPASMRARFRAAAPAAAAVAAALPTLQCKQCC
jgi:hypothetical protein